MDSETSKANEVVANLPQRLAEAAMGIADLIGALPMAKHLLGAAVTLLLRAIGREETICYLVDLAGKLEDRNT